MGAGTSVQPHSWSAGAQFEPQSVVVPGPSRHAWLWKASWGPTWGQQAALSQREHGSGHQITPTPASQKV